MKISKKDQKDFGITDKMLEKAGGYSFGGKFQEKIILKAPNDQMINDWHATI